jgi:xylulokinase
MSEHEPAIVAIDLGTTEVKAGLVARDGRMLAATRAAYGIDLDPASGRGEQDPEEWWAAIANVTRGLAAAGSGDIAAICCVGQGPTMAPVDALGRATSAAITWMDRRASDEAKLLTDATGVTGWKLGILPAALWFEHHHPAAAARTRWYLNSWEWALMRLTGRAVMTHWRGQQLVDPSLAAASGLSTERLAPVVETGALGGMLGDRAADDLGLPAGLPVVAGTVDSFASFLGAGLSRSGEAVDTGGTSGGLAVYWDSPAEITGGSVAEAPLTGLWVLGGAMTATGKSLEWFADLVRGAESGTESGTEDLINQAALIAPGSDGLLFLPYLAGERSPNWDPLARGAFVGLTLSHQRPHLVRAILEAAAFALRHVATSIVAAGLRIDEVRVSGGTARSDIWNQIKADVLGVPVAVPEVPETAVLGAAIIAAQGIGWHAETLDAMRSMVRIDHRLEPNLANRAVYDTLFAAYVDLWPAISPVVHRLHGLQGGLAEG